MKAHQALWPIATQCRVLGVSTSGYYAWLKRPPSLHRELDVAIGDHIEGFYDASLQTHGRDRQDAANFHGELMKRIPLERRTAGKPLIAIINSGNVWFLSPKVILASIFVRWAGTVCVAIIEHFSIGACDPYLREALSKRARARSSSSYKSG